MNIRPTTAPVNGANGANGTASSNGAHIAARPLLLHQELWQIIRRGKGRMVVMLLLGIVLAGVYCSFAGPWYDSSAQLLVIKKRFDTAPITGIDQIRGPEDYLSTHMLLIASRRVIGHAIEKEGLQELKQFRERPGLKQSIMDWIGPMLAEADVEIRHEDRLTNDIINSLVVTRDAQRPGVNPSNEILNLSIRGRVANDCPKILNAIIASYQEFLKENYRNANAETLELIAQARGMVQKDLEAKEAAYQKFLAETPPLWKTQDRSTAHQDRLFKIDAKLTALRVRRAEIEASIAMIENAIKNGRNPAAIVERLCTFPTTGGFGPANPLAGPEPWLAETTGKASLEEQLINLQVQKAKLLALRGASHPDVVALCRQIDTVRGMIAPSTGSAVARRDGSNDTDVGKLKLELLKQERDDLVLAEESVGKLFAAEQKGVSASYIQEIQDEAHRKGIERDRLLYESILARLKETSSVKDFGGYNTQVIGPALTGTLAVKKYLLIVGLGAFAGIFAGFAWAYLAVIGTRKTDSAA